MFEKDKMQKLGRNDPCPCGSGLKYKKCCLGRKGAPQKDFRDLYERKYGIRLKGKKDVQAIRRAGLLALATLDLWRVRFGRG